MAIIAYSETLIRFPSGSGVGTNIDILNKTQGSKVDPVRRELGTTYNSRALIDACKPFEWFDDFPEVAESSPEYIEGVRKKWQELFRR
jgi:hypothetical protein